MTGFEYALAGLMIKNGYVSEGEAMVAAIRDRYDGEKRNPWNELECGSNYARSMASFALMNIYSGFSFDMTKNHIGFSPISRQGGRFLWSIADTWGSVTVSDEAHELTVSGTPLTLSSYQINRYAQVSDVTADGKKVKFTQNGDVLVLGKITVETRLEIKLA